MSLAFIAYSALHQPEGRQAGLLRPLATPPSLAAGPALAGGSRPATSDAGQPSQRPTGAGTTPATPGSPAGTPLVVLDNTGRAELARAATEHFEQGGWTVTETSTFDGDILSTAAYYDPATPGAQAAAQALQAQFPEIRRVRPKFDGLGPGAIVVVLTYDYSQGQTTS
ncbi:MAG TPA: LytR C-terminal domain-containing protein [Jatrophihabitans sp.]|nr:LytR C-terminal domain-containing protein [Jatrophihabitans sp.]